MALATHLILQRRALPDLPANASAATPFVREFSLFGTYGRVTFWAPPEVAEPVCDRLQAELQKIHDMINRFDPNSEISRLNMEARERPFQCSEALWGLLLLCRQAYEETDGAFDVSVGPLMQLWGFHRKRTTYPTAEEVRDALASVGMDKFVFDDAARTVCFTRPAACLDMGGIAKGYALDHAARTARSGGIRAGLIDLGGNVCCLDEPPPGRRHYSIGVRDPFNRDTLLGTVRTTSCTVATSGNYENCFELEGKIVHHIIDPRTGYPVPDVASVTVITPAGVDSDVFSTAVFVAGETLVRKLRASRRRTSVLIVKLNHQGKSEVTRYGWVWQEYT
ncbi:MAG: FAD:protein FMN transferase, partial [Planctomycetes bacterium]|nr:FAD:protein FMN transferase [Planctomycetota bacterium]